MSHHPQVWIPSSGRGTATGTRWLPLLLLLAVTAMLSAGCSRAHYRRNADQEVYSLLDCGSRDPRWPLPDYTIDPDPKSRMAYPYSPDCPPLPPDDPTAHLLMQCVDCKKGWPCWKHRGRTPHVENPFWRAYLPTNEDGEVIIDRQGAVQLALVHAPSYQQQLENLYLSALEVTFQRYQFDTIFFARNATFFTAGRTNGESRSTLATDTGLGFRRAFATGGNMVVDVANSLVWQFAGPDTYSATSLASFSLFQPLLRGAGRQIALESLTDSERALLYNIRQMEFFRHGFYMQVIAGANPATGNFGAAGSGGYFGLLQSQIRIRNQEIYVRGLRNYVEQMEAFYRSERVTAYNVDVARQNFYEAQSALLRLVNEYENSLDSYKISLGLPPDVELNVEDHLVDQFNLLTPSMIATQEKAEDFLSIIRDPGVPLPADYLKQMLEARSETLERIEDVRGDLKHLAAQLPRRRRELEGASNRPEIRELQLDANAWSVSALDARYEALVDEFEYQTQPPDVPLPPDAIVPLSRRLEDVKEFTDDPPAFTAKRLPLTPEDRQSLGLTDPAAVAAEMDRRQRQVARDVLDELTYALWTLSILQARIRLEAVTLVPVDLDSDTAFSIARQNRLDWMNERGALVDQWRQIEIAADALQADLDVRLSGNIGTTGNNPARFSSTNSQLRVGFEFDSPLDRLRERNAYRATLVAYARARRDYYSFEDRVHQNLRLTLRTLMLTQLNFELLRIQLRSTISQVEQTQLRLREPAKAGASAGQSSFNESSAREMAFAQQSLLNAQNSLLGSWVGYEVLRMSLDFQLGTMRLDEQGMWLDPGPIEEPQTSTPPVPAEIIPPGVEMPLGVTLDEEPADNGQPPASDRAGEPRLPGFSLPVPAPPLAPQNAAAPVPQLLPAMENQ